MNKESESLTYLVELALDGEKEIHHSKIFDSEEIILNAIKRNEPMQPTKHESGVFECPCCGESSPLYYNDNLSKPNFCGECGQALDWSSSNE